MQLSFAPMIRLAKTNRPDKYPEVSVVLATVTSFFVFYFLHGCVVLVRHTLDAIGMDLDHHHLWMIKVGNNLFSNSGIPEFGNRNSDLEFRISNFFFLYGMKHHKLACGVIIMKAILFCEHPKINQN